MKPPIKKKPSIRSNTKLGKLLHDSVERNSVEIKDTSNALFKQSDKLIDSIKESMALEEFSLVELDEKLSNLNKKSKNYDEVKKTLITKRREIVAKIDSLEDLSSNALVSTALMEKLLQDLKAGKDREVTSALISEQIYSLSELDSKSKSLGVKSRFDRDEIISTSSGFLEKKEKEKLNKKLKRLDATYNLGHKTGFFSTVTEGALASVLGPLGKPLADTLNLTDKLFNAEKKKEVLEKKSDENIQKILALLENSEMAPENKVLIKNKLDRDEQDEELEEDRTQDFRAETLALQKENLTKTEENGIGFAEMLAYLTGGKIVTALAGALIPMLLKTIGKGGAIAAAYEAGAFIGTKIEPYVKPYLKKALDVVPDNAISALTQNQNVDASTLGRDFMKKKKDNRLNRKFQKFKEENGLSPKAQKVMQVFENPAVEWATQNGTETSVFRYIKSKETLANDILNNATTNMNIFSSAVNNNVFSELMNANSVRNVEAFGLPSVTNNVPSPMARKKPKSTTTNSSGGGRVNIDQIPNIIDDKGLNAINQQIIGR